MANMIHKSASQSQNPAAHLSPSFHIWDNPGKVIDRNGRTVDTTREIWCLHEPTDSIDLNWNTLNVAWDIKDAIKAHVAQKIESKAPGTAYQVFAQLKYCFAR